MDRLEEIKARCEAATRGPWKAYGMYVFGAEYPSGIYAGKKPCVAETKPEPCSDRCAVDDAAFIAAAYEDIPYLLGMVETLRAGQELMEAEVSRLTAERNAALDDLRKDCTTCLHKGKSGLSAPCLGCQGANYVNWQWRGLCADNRREKK